MKLATYTHQGLRRVGVVSADDATIAPLNVGADVQAVIDHLAAGATLPAPGVAVPLAQVQLLAPIPRPRRNVFCVGLNYRSHAAELAARGFNGAKTVDDLIPKAAVVFSKVPESVIGPGAAIELPAASKAVDYEAELAVAIGKRGRGIARANALEHVFGYTIVNDVSARDLQKRHQQWLLAKSCDTFCPMGPWIVTRDALDAADLRVRLSVNGQPRQDARTSDLVFDIPAIIEAISAACTLLPGDVIATGTPAGVAMGFDPAPWLQDGDVVRIEIEGIGVLENPVRAAGG